MGKRALEPREHEFDQHLTARARLHPERLAGGSHVGPRSEPEDAGLGQAQEHRVERPGVSHLDPQAAQHVAPWPIARRRGRDHQSTAGLDVAFKPVGQ